MNTVWVLLCLFILILFLEIVITNNIFILRFRLIHRKNTISTKHQAIQTHTTRDWIIFIIRIGISFSIWGI